MTEPGSRVTSWLVLRGRKDVQGARLEVPAGFCFAPQPSRQTPLPRSGCLQPTGPEPRGEQGTHVWNPPPPERRQAERGLRGRCFHGSAGAAVVALVWWRAAR